MRTTRLLFPLGLAALTLFSSGYPLAQSKTAATTGSLAADLEDPVRQAALRKQAERLLDCPRPADAKSLAAAFAEQAAMKWDYSKMGCGVRYGFELAQLQPDDVPLQLQALGAQVDYFTVLDKEYSPLYSASALKDAELKLRWTQTRQRAQTLLERLQPAAEQVPEVLALRGVYHLLSLQHEAPESEKLKAPGLALPDLESAIKSKPGVLDGAGLLTLGSVLMDLPEFAGGDSERAVALFVQGAGVAPANLELKIALINAYLAERAQDKAVAVLRQAAAIPAEGQNLQDYADALRSLSGQAVRLQQMDLARQLAERRDALLAGHAYLNPRKSTATAGHGGVDPLTGEDPDKIK